MIGSFCLTPTIALRPAKPLERLERSQRQAFTLIEILVTLFILMILASIALPLTRNAIRDQRNVRASQLLLSFIESTRNQAIAENREMGVIFERLGTDDFGRSASVEVRQLRGLPTYTGETSNARATLINDTVGPPVGAGMVNAARFDVFESPLVLLSYQIFNDPVRDDSTAPIQTGQYMELPGGQLATIGRFRREDNNPLTPVIVGLDIHQPENPAAPQSGRGNPHGIKVTTPDHQKVPYAIHRTPVVSAARSVSLPRGAVIDFNYSGFGIRGSQFSPLGSDPSDVSIAVFFDSQGRISRIRYREAVGYVPPLGQLFFCVGDSDGVQTEIEDLLENDRRNRANILRPNSAWIMLNPETGRVTASPLASVTAPDGDFTTMTVSSAIEQARRLANLGDTLE